MIGLHHEKFLARKTRRILHELGLINCISHAIWIWAGVALYFFAIVEILSSPSGNEFISDQKGIGISPRRITVSTAGYADFMKRMADEERKVKLALSLHSLRDDVRTSLMPINKKNNVEELLSALEYYKRKTKKGIMLEYILFDGINDNDEDVRLLVKASRRLNCRVNLIPFHSIEFTNPHGISATLRGASKEGIERFWKKLRSYEISVFIRHSAGADIDAACGQLAIKEEMITL